MVSGYHTCLTHVLGPRPKGTTYSEPPTGQPVAADLLLTQQFPQRGINEVILKKKKKKDLNTRNMIMEG